MEIYLVGGAVRDELLGIPVSERDWCVVGETPDSLERKGFRPVGRDFPVFIHPKSGEEYALARTERKTGVGYHGFSFYCAPDVSIEEDLGRRDLSINAMARDHDGMLIDPYGGVSDVQEKVLRHVSDAFAEDPVRILRVARFAARFHHLGFRIAGETMRLMHEMVASGEVNALIADRVWKETEKALVGKNPRVFFEVLRSCGALGIVFPEIDALFGVPQPAKWHPEIDCGLHTMMALEQSAALSEALEVRFAALVHDLGKATTPASVLPRHSGHEKRGVKIVKSLANRLPVPKECRELGCLVAEYHFHAHRARELRPATLLKVLNRIDAFRRAERFSQFLLACEADARGRTGFQDSPYPQAEYLRGAFAAASLVDIEDLVDSDRDGREIGEEIASRRESALATYKQENLLQEPPKK